MGRAVWAQLLQPSDREPLWLQREAETTATPFQWLPVTLLLHLWARSWSTSEPVWIICITPDHSMQACAIRATPHFCWAAGPSFFYSIKKYCLQSGPWHEQETGTPKLRTSNESGFLKCGVQHFLIVLEGYSRQIFWAWGRSSQWSDLNTLSLIWKSDVVSSCHIPLLELQGSLTHNFKAKSRHHLGLLHQPQYSTALPDTSAHAACSRKVLISLISWGSRSFFQVHYFLDFALCAISTIFFVDSHGAEHMLRQRRRTPQLTLILLPGNTQIKFWCLAVRIHSIKEHWV